MKLKLLGLFTFLLLILSACSSSGSMGGMDMGNKQEKTANKENTENKAIPAATATKTLTGNTFNLVAKEAKQQLNEKVSVTAWTFNGSVPGSQIRVKQGEKVIINLKNELPDPVTIHWHGVPLPNNMDGIPGVTQNAVQPGKSFTYSFTATVPGTYMYHSHQDGVNQVDKGLYGSLIVEPEKPTYDRDYSLMLDEWMSKPDQMNMEGMKGNNSMEGQDKMKGMDMGSDSSSKGNNKEKDSNGGMAMGDDMSAYDIFTINGKSGKEVEPLKVKKGETVRIRLANIGNMTHRFHLHGQSFKVVAIDGQELKDPQTIKDQLISVSPGERYDIEFIADNPGKWFLECHGEMKGTPGMKTVIEYEGSTKSTDQSNQKEKLPVFDYTTYGKQSAGPFTLDQKYDVEYTMNLNTELKENATVFTINGKTFPETDNIEVNKGDLVKVRLVNNSKKEDHPMHLHGHFFQILSKNGKPLTGSPIMKDTVNLKPGDEYIIAFKADNPGNWLFHCHDLHHASAGMVTMVKYNGFEPNFKVDPKANNKPE